MFFHLHRALLMCLMFHGTVKGNICVPHVHCFQPQLQWVLQIHPPGCRTQWIQRANCTTPFYMRNLSILGFCYAQGVLEPSPHKCRWTTVLTDDRNLSYCYKVLDYREQQVCKIQNKNIFQHFHIQDLFFPALLRYKNNRSCIHLSYST